MPASYREHPPPAGLERVVACLWEQQSAVPWRQRVIPDGCVDLIWLGPGELVFAGPDTGPRVADLPAVARVAGVRLRPGAAGAVLGMPASELCNLETAAADVWAKPAGALEEAVSLAPPGRRLELLADAVAARRAEPDLLVAAAGRMLSRPRASVSGVAAELGFSERTLHRRTVAAVGYGPKVLARVARLRRLVAAEDDVLALRALEAGYASQAHMNEEVRRLTGTTAVRFLKDAALTAA